MMYESIWSSKKQESYKERAGRKRSARSFRILRKKADSCIIEKKENGDKMYETKI